MKIACEIPVSILDKITPHTDYDFVIASHCLKNKAYKDFYINLRKGAPYREMILDNGAFEEGKAIDDFNAYKELIYELRPNIIVLPDAINDAGYTVAKSFDFIACHPQVAEDFNLMGVLQGTSIFDYQDYALKHFIGNENITHIGIPYHLFYRPILFEKTDILKICKDNGLKVHILGLPNPFEVYDLARTEWKDIIVSIDTSLPVVSGMNKFDFSKGKFKRFKLNIEEVCNEEQVLLIKDNIDYLRYLIKYG